MQCGLASTPRRPGARPMFACKMFAAKKAATAVREVAEGHNQQLPLPQLEELVASVQAVMTHRAGREDAWKGEGPEEEETEEAAPLFPSPWPAGMGSAFAVLGPAGSGKTTAVHQAIQEAVNNGARVLLTAPTGRLAATMREKFPESEVDTAHGAFLVYKPVQETLELMWPYDLVIVEEVGQLSKANFERIMEQWIAAARLPTLVLRGGLLSVARCGSWM